LWTTNKSGLDRGVKIATVASRRVKSDQPLRLGGAAPQNPKKLMSAHCLQLVKCFLYSHCPPPVCVGLCGHKDALPCRGEHGPHLLTFRSCSSRIHLVACSTPPPCSLQAGPRLFQTDPKIITPSHHHTPGFQKCLHAGGVTRQHQERHRVGLKARAKMIQSS
jgi:hypothetical protein